MEMTAAQTIVHNMYTVHNSARTRCMMLLFLIRVKMIGRFNFLVQMWRTPCVHSVVYPSR